MENLLHNVNGKLTTKCKWKTYYSSKLLFDFNRTKMFDSLEVMTQNVSYDGGCRSLLQSYLIQHDIELLPLQQLFMTKLSQKGHLSIDPVKKMLM